MDEIDNPEIKKPQPLIKKKMSRKERKHTDFPNDPVKGRTYHKWSTFFFVLACIATALALLALIMPVFLAVIGAFSAMLWFLVIALASIFTLFTIWQNKGFKAFSDSWSDFNMSLLDSLNGTNDFIMRIVPTLLISGGVVILIAWIFLVIGIVIDKERKKKYLGKIIALGVLTLIYIVLTIILL